MGPQVGDIDQVGSRGRAMHGKVAGAADPLAVDQSLVLSRLGSLRLASGVDIAVLSREKGQG